MRNAKGRRQWGGITPILSSPMLRRGPLDLQPSSIVRITPFMKTIRIIKTIGRLDEREDRIAIDQPMDRLTFRERNICILGHCSHQLSLQVD